MKYPHPLPVKDFSLQLLFSHLNGIMIKVDDEDGGEKRIEKKKLYVNVDFLIIYGYNKNSLKH